MQWAAWEARAGCPVGGNPEGATWETSVREELALEGPGAGAGRNRLVLRTQASRLPRQPGSASPPSPERRARTGAAWGLLLGSWAGGASGAGRAE